MTTQTDNPTTNDIKSLIQSKQEELSCLEQVYEQLSRLHNMYLSGNLEDVDRARHLKDAVEGCVNEQARVTNELQFLSV